MRAWVTYETEEGELLILKEDGADSVKVVAQVMSEELDDPKATARLIAGAPEMYTALIAAVEALRATKTFLSTNGYEVNELDEIVAAIDDTLHSIGVEQD
ncbi:MAG: hypothetical protein IJR85_08140 [Synergistaceae bacterium]|nr:hypothetical protein [Synergistaceae bacterium]